MDESVGRQHHQQPRVGFSPQPHTPGPVAPLRHVYVIPQVQAMGELIKAGKIKHWGVSNETTYGEGRTLR